MKHLSMWILLVSMIPLFATTTSTIIGIDVPEMEQVGQYWRIHLPGSAKITDPGKPAVPSIPVRLLLPPGEKATTITVNILDEQVIPGVFVLEPIQQPVPLSRPELYTVTNPNADVYGSDNPWPLTSWSNLDTQYFRGYSIAIASVHPVRYRPLSGEITVGTRFEVVVESTPDPQAQTAHQTFYRGDEQSKAKCESYVRNASDTAVYPSLRPTRNNENLLVIITGGAQASYFNDFLTFKRKQGFNPILETTQNIYTQYTGADNADKIRNFIKYCYEELGTLYVILGGDIDIVPHRGFYVLAGDTEDTGIPADHYYAALDRVGNGTGPDFNCDNDNRWGEPTESDFMPEVAVGRFTANSATQFANIINKQLKYQQTPVIADLEKALMVGEQLNDNPLTWGGDYKDQIISGGSFNGYQTAGISANFETDTMYERDYDWSRQNLQTAMNSGLNLLNHLGHSNTDYNMKFEPNHVTTTNITANGINHNFFIIYSQGCYPASFDYNDAIAEDFTSIANGCVAYVGNSRYGWYSPGGTDASSQYFDRQFFDAIFGEDIYRIGDAQNDSKIEGINMMEDAWMRWTFYELNLLGDPTLDIWTAAPVALTPSYPTALPLGSSQINVLTGIPNALVGLSRDGQVLASGSANNIGVFAANLPPQTQLGTIDVWITAHDFLIHTGTITIIPSDEPYVTINDVTIHTTDGDDVIEFGEEVTLDLIVENLGGQGTSNVTIGFQTVSNYVELSQFMANITQIAAEESITLPNAIRFTVDNNVPDNTPILMNVSISNGSSQWPTEISLSARAPIIAATGFTVEDGNNALLEPGETATLEVNIANTGGADSGPLTISLQGTNPFIDVMNANTLSIDVDAEASASLELEVAVDILTPYGYLGVFDVLATNQYGQQTPFQLIIPVGQVIEGFEINDISFYPFESGGNAAWGRTTTSAHNGTRSLRSGSIGNNANSSLSLTVDVLVDGNIAFWKRVSCEDSNTQEYDRLAFFIDNQEMGRWDGETAWSRSTFPVSAGTHTFTWDYIKDMYSVSGSDCAWIDDIEFPTFVATEIPSLFIDNNQLNYNQIDPGVPATMYFTIFNLGVVDLEGTLTPPDGMVLSILGSRNDTRKPNRTREDLDFSVQVGASLMVQAVLTLQQQGPIDLGIFYTSNDPYHSAGIIDVIGHCGVGVDTPYADFEDRVFGNNPNPFNPETTIRFSVKNNHTPVQISVYNLRGQKIRDLRDGYLDTGLHQVIWDGKDDRGQSIASGVYFYRARIGTLTETRKMMLMK